MNRTAGLTLVELMVVIALLTATAAILLPLHSHYQAEAARSVCRVQLGQIGTALGRYAMAHEGRLPAARPMPKPIDGPAALPALPMVVSRYVSRAATAFHCPGDELMLFAMCGSSYYYDTAAAFGTGTTAETADATPMIWDADNVTLRARGESIHVPPFHGRRMVGYRDGHVASQSDPLPPPFGR